MARGNALAMLQQLSAFHFSPAWSRSISCRAIRGVDRKARASVPSGSRASPQSEGRTVEHPVRNTSSQQSYLVTCHPGLEEVTAEELRQQGLQAQHSLQDVQAIAPGRVTFWSNSAAAGYAAALNLRSATRVLHLIHEEVLDPERAAGDTVYEFTREAVPWHEWLAPRQTFGIHCLHFYNNSNITNSQLVGRRIRDAICDQVRDARGMRPAPPDGTPDLPIVFQMLNNKLQLFRDLGGGSLHRRGYRSHAAVHKAALNEAAAAGLLLIAGWDGKCRQPGAILADPMCGSGTFLVEAALMATQTAPGLLRDIPWPFQNWHDFSNHHWRKAVRAAEVRAKEGQHLWAEMDGRLLGNDMHAGALKLAQEASSAASVAKLISFNNKSCANWIPKRTPTMVVVNPPWGIRLLSGQDQAGSSSRVEQQQQRRGGGRWEQQRQRWQQHEEIDDDDLAETWQQLSIFLKQQCPGAEAWVLSGNPETTQHLGMRSSKKRSISVGGMKTAWLKYEVRGPVTAQQVADEQPGYPKL